MISELINDLKDPLSDFIPCPPALKRSSWITLPEDLKSRLVHSAETYLKFDYPSLTAVDFMEFSKTGNRSHYEEKQFKRRIALSTLVLGECIEYKGRFLDDIINGVYIICEENAWQLPAHNSYLRDSPQSILPDITRPVIDLFAAETGAVLSMTEYLLRDALTRISPFLNKMVNKNLEERIITPYLSNHFWWMGDGLTPMNNWTVWCTQNILLTAFTRGSNDSRKEQILRKACKSIDYFLEEYGEDGCCDEGAQYYRHAGLCLFNCLEIINGISNHACSSAFKINKIKNIASYIVNVHVDTIYYLNFADCSPIAGRCNAREFLFGKRTGNKDLMAFAASDYQNSEDPLLEEEHNLFYRTQTIFSHTDMLSFNNKSMIHPKDFWYESVGIFITRDKHLYLAVKAGDNNDSHNHNDTGSFTVYKNGKPFLIDIGVETYTKKTFSPNRYDIWTMQSRYHNLPSFWDKGVELVQHNGSQYKAKQVSHQLNSASSFITLDIGDAYPDKRIHSYQRTAVLNKDENITITDHYEGDIPCPVLSLMVWDEPLIREHTITVGNLGCIQITGCSHIQKEKIPITDNRLKTAWNQEIYRVLVTMYHQDLTLIIQ
ncbi:heparinase II/III family protein [Clostridium sp. E02]|uniref:heparinase II/III domain-containing protein n=1 Tax=Clostridium sp. E02 TaxID=2487134 RepID=UPI000F530805|nr:heparinase II/III family protein [Clostridium sp. E02]